MTDTTDIAALKINTYSVNNNDAWPQCADDDRTGSYVKWEDLVKLLSDKRQGKEPETRFDSLKNLKFVADCCIENPDSIYASEFFLLLDEMFGKQGDYSMPAQAVAVSHLIGQLEAERQRADAAELELIKPLPIGELIQRLEGQTYEKWFSQSELKGDQVPDGYIFQHPSGKLFWSIISESCANNKGVVPYYLTAQQKPVVLRQIGSIDHDGGEYGEYFVEFTDSASIGQAVYVIDSAIEAAGNDKVGE